MKLWEVQKLFIGGLNLRRIAVSVLINVLLIMALCLEKERKDIFANMKMNLCRSYQVVLGVLVAVIIFIGAAVAVNFDKVFVIFHKIFFDNDLWIFDPAEDYMIRMLPQGLFFDFVIRIGSIFIGTLLLGAIVSVLLTRKNK